MLSNLLWWPWAGIGGGGPPVVVSPVRTRLPRERRLRREWEVPVTVEDLEEEDDAILLILEGLS